MNTVKMKRNAIIGLIGGLLFGIGDLLVSLLPHYWDQSKIAEDWVQMSDLRPASAMYLGCIGAVLILVGFYSWYAAVKENGTNRLKCLMGSIAIGIMMTPIGHFIILCIAPMAYKGAIQAGASTEMATKIVDYWGTYTGPVRVYVMFFVILVQSVTMIGLILKRKINCPKWMVLCNPLGLTLLSIPFSILLSGTGLEGIVESFESIGEGLIYLPVYYHWKKCSN